MDFKTYRKLSAGAAIKYFTIEWIIEKVHMGQAYTSNAN